MVWRDHRVRHFIDNNFFQSFAQYLFHRLSSNGRGDDLHFTGGDVFAHYKRLSLQSFYFVAVLMEDTLDVQRSLPGVKLATEDRFPLFQNRSCAFEYASLFTLDVHLQQVRKWMSGDKIVEGYRSQFQAGPFGCFGGNT